MTPEQHRHAAKARPGQAVYPRDAGRPWPDQPTRLDLTRIPAHTDTPATSALRGEVARLHATRRPADVALARLLHTAARQLDSDGDGACAGELLERAQQYGTELAAAAGRGRDTPGWAVLVICAVISTITVIVAGIGPAAGWWWSGG